MEKVKSVYVRYEASDTIQNQGKRSDIEKYLRMGYYVKEYRNGYWVLVKPVQVNVTVSTSFATKTFNMKESICNYYGKTRISSTLVDKFQKDIVSESISIYMGEEGDYTLK